MNLWKSYKDVLHEMFPLHNRAGSVWAQWESKGTSLTAKTYTTPYFIKAREVEIWDDKSCIYNNICLLYTSPSPRDLSTSRMPSSA